MNLSAVNGFNHIAGLHSGSLGRISVHNPCQAGGVIPRNADEHHGKAEGQDKIKHRPGCNHGNPGPYGLVVKRAFICNPLVFPQHHAGAAKRQYLKGIPGTAFFKAEQPWPHAKGKFNDTYSI